MENKEVVVVVVILVGLLVINNRPYTGYQVFPISARGSGPMWYPAQAKEGDSGAPREIIANPMPASVPFVNNAPQPELEWSKRCTTYQDCPRGWMCDRQTRFCKYPP